MAFNSYTYLLFFLAVYAMFLLVEEGGRWCVLLGASILFYAALKVPSLLLVLGVVTVTTYLFGQALGQAETRLSRRVILWSGCALNLLILVGMKYLPFLAENLNALLALFPLKIELCPVKAPVAIGVSFYVFQAMSYLFDLYYGELEAPERHLGYFALYLAFFPKLLQGPLERAGELIPQLRAKFEFDRGNLRTGAQLLLWGMGKKILVADPLGLYVDGVYNHVHAYSGVPLVLATYAYAVQIYMDFSGYTDMALGSGRLFNITLSPNFNKPYRATSIADFWRRWHMSLYRWIRDYLFEPLQVQWRNLGRWGTALALVVAFLLSGFWHGASWGFIVWGGLHGIYMACGVFYKPYQKKIYRLLSMERTRGVKLWQAFVTCQLVCFAWIFFRANTIEDAWYVVTHLCSWGTLSTVLLQSVQACVRTVMG